MAAVAKSGTPSIAVDSPPQTDMLTGLVAGETLAPGDACYIKTSDGKVWRSNGTSANAAAKVRGYATMPATAGMAVTLFRNMRFRYGAGLSPGADLFLSSATAGGLSDTATTGGSAPIGYVVDATRVQLFESRY